MKRSTFLNVALASVANLSGPGTRPVIASEPRKPRSVNRPLAQDFTVVAGVPPATDDSYAFFLSNAFAMLPGGTLLAASPMVLRMKGDKGVKGRSVLVARSRDAGLSWEVVAELPQRELVEVALFPADGRVYMFIGPRTREGTIRVSKSENEGESWSEPMEVIKKEPDLPTPAHEVAKAGGDPVEVANKGQAWYCLHQTAMAVRDGRLFLAVSEICQRLRLVSCDLRNILDPESWKISEAVEMPVPKELNPGLFPGPSMRCLEGNVVQVNGRLRVLARAVIDRQGTANLAAVFDVQAEQSQPALSFTQFYPTPGGQCKFYIVHDPASTLFWMASNLPTDSQKRADPDVPDIYRSHDRRFLMLWYSRDALNWFPAGCIAGTTDPRQSFMYPSLIVAGDDLLVLSRTAYSSGKAHDADLLTFHRVQRFRELAMDIRTIET